MEREEIIKYLIAQKNIAQYSQDTVSGEDLKSLMQYDIDALQGAIDIIEDKAKELNNGK